MCISICTQDYYLGAIMCKIFKILFNGTEAIGEKAITKSTFAVMLI